MDGGFQTAATSRGEIAVTVGVVIPSIATVCLAFLLTAYSPITSAYADNHPSAMRTRALAQYCIPSDGEVDPGWLYC